MANQGLLKTLETAKRHLPSTPPPSSASIEELRVSLAPAVLTGDNISSGANLLPKLANPTKLNSILSDPHVDTAKCLQIFNLVLTECRRCPLTPKPSLRAHVTLAGRLLKLRYFPDAEKILKNAAVDPDFRYPFATFVEWVERYCKESNIIAKLLNQLLKVYSDHHLFDKCSSVFDYMITNGLQVDERTCTIHLHSLVRHLQIGSALHLFHRMVESGVKVSVYSLTVIVKGLCDNGEIKKARELVQEMSVSRGIKPNLVTCNTLVDACTKRWNFEELPLILELMCKEEIEFNDTTYKLLIDGYSGFGKVKEAERCLLEMLEKGFKVDNHLCSTVIGGFFKHGNHLEAGVLSLLYRLMEKGITVNDDICGDIVDRLYKAGKWELVEELMNKLRRGVER